MYNHFLRSMSRFVGLIYIIITRIILFSKALLQCVWHKNLIKVGSLLGSQLLCFRTQFYKFRITNL